MGASLDILNMKPQRGAACQQALRIAPRGDPPLGAAFIFLQIATLEDRVACKNICRAGEA
jgi:hypothetical protein